MSPDRPHKVGIEITGRCNLLCTTCLRDIDNASDDMDFDLFSSLVGQAREAGAEVISLTGGEPTIHPRFGDMARRVIESGMRLKFVTNAFRPDPMFRLMADPIARAGIECVALSIDGATPQVHDAIRGNGSYKRLLAAAGVLRLRRIPFQFQFIVNGSNRDEIEPMALLAAKVGADRLCFGFYQPTLREYNDGLRLDAEAMMTAQEDIRRLQGIFRMPILLSIGIHPDDPLRPCGVMQGEVWHVNCRGQMSFCCQLSNLYDQKRPDRYDSDVVADLCREPMRKGQERFREALAELQAAKQRDFRSGSLTPDEAFACCYCLKHFGKRSVPKTLAIESGHEHTVAS